MAAEPEQLARESINNLRAIGADHLFESSTTRIGIRRGVYLRRYVYDFIELFAPHLKRKMVEAAMSESKGSDCQL